jgi:hypothetical protein
VSHNHTMASEVLALLFGVIAFGNTKDAVRPHGRRLTGAAARGYRWGPGPGMAP